MMTDKPKITISSSPSSTSPTTHDGSEKQAASKSNTITKSTQKSVKGSSASTQEVKSPEVNTSETKTPHTKVPENKLNSASSNSTSIINDTDPNKKADNSQNTSGQNKNNVKSSHQNEANNSTSPQSFATKKPNTKNNPMKTDLNSATPQKKSKLAILALFIAFIAIVGVVALYFWHVQQQLIITSQQSNLTKQLQQIKKESVQGNALAQQKMIETLKTQEKNLAKQFANSAQNMKKETQQNISKLNQMVEKFSQNQPTDWLVHEAEYLVRIASRTLWLEKDTTAAIGLLQDADARITELNDPEILPIRQLIYQDIEALKSVPKLETETTILSLMALAEQVKNLPLVTMSTSEQATNAGEFTLSDNIADWRENLSKTWNNFLETFVVIHSKVGELDPILPAEQRQNLKENLNLKLQIAQWAASKGKPELFATSLNNAQLWVKQYFDLNAPENIAFIESIEALKSKNITIKTDLKLNSLHEIRKILKREKPASLPITPFAAPIQKRIQNQLTDERKSEIKTNFKSLTENNKIEKNTPPNNTTKPELANKQPNNIKNNDKSNVEDNDKTNTKNKNNIIDQEKTPEKQPNKAVEKVIDKALKASEVSEATQ